MPVSRLLRCRPRFREEGGDRTGLLAAGLTAVAWIVRLQNNCLRIASGNQEG